MLNLTKTDLCCVSIDHLSFAIEAQDLEADAGRATGLDLM